MEEMIICKENILFQFYCADCLEAMENIPKESVDLILCDLPYSCGKTAHKWDKEIDLTRLWEQYKRVLKSDGIICLFGNEPFTSKLIQSNVNMFRYKMIWQKESPTGFLNCNYKPLSQFEDIVIFSNGTIGSRSKLPIRYYPQGLVEVEQVKHNNPNSTWRINKGYGGNNKLNSNSEYIQHYTNYPTDILKFARDKNAVHPTQKPVALLEYLIKTYTKEGEMILDNCMGSGSTGVACKNTKRKFIGIEIDEKYYKIAKERINESGK